MFKQDAINYFGSKSKLAKAAGVAPASVSVWGDLVPEKNAMRLQLASEGVFRLLLKVSFITTNIFTTNIVTKNVLVR